MFLGRGGSIRVREVDLKSETLKIVQSSPGLQVTWFPRLRLLIHG